MAERSAVNRVILVRVQVGERRYSTLVTGSMGSSDGLGGMAKSVLSVSTV